jgi:hypothetical protein
MPQLRIVKVGIKWCKGIFVIFSEENLTDLKKKKKKGLKLAHNKTISGI